jgi:hypothetical protein
MDQLAKLLDSVTKLFSNMPHPDRYAWIRLGLSAFSVVLTVITIIRSRRQGDKLLDAAILRLKGRIRSRTANPELTSVTAIRALARAIQKEMNSPVLTDGAIGEAIRSVALELEDKYRGAALVRRLAVLNEALKELDPGGGGLLSIAAIDRMAAYYLSQIATLAELVTLQIVVEVALSAAQSRIAPRGNLLFVVSFLFPAIYLWFVLANCRASGYWASNAGSMNEGEEGEHRHQALQLNPVLDFFAFQTSSLNNRFLNLIWGPIWEAPLTFVPSFVRKHQYRYSELKKIYNELNRLEPFMSIVRSGLAPAVGSEVSAYRKLCERLWVLTGDERYQQEIRAFATSGDIH